MSQQVKSTRFDRATLAVCAALILAAATVVPLSASAHDPDQHGAMPAEASTAMDHSKMTGMKHTEGMSMTGDADLDFAANMRTHHQMAVSMSRALIKNGKNPQMLRLARDIITAQNKEIALLDQWVKAHKKTASMAAPKAK